MKRSFRATFVVAVLLASLVGLAGFRWQSASALEEPLPAKPADPADPFGGKAEVVGEKTEPVVEKADDSEPFQTRVLRVPERDPQEVARLLTELFGDKVNVIVDDRTNSIIVRVARAKLASEVEFYLKEIDATVKRIAAEPVANRRPPTVSVPVATARASVDSADASMDREAKQLAARVRSAAEPEKSKLRAELEQLTGKHFEHRQQQRAAEIKDLADRVDKLQVAHHRRQESKADIIKRRLADLLDEQNELKWDDRPAGFSSLRPTYTASVPLSRTIEKDSNDAMWTHFGVRLKRMTVAEFDAEKLVYRGGLRVIEVQPVVKKEDIGFQVGDILVGLHEWELHSFEDVAFIIDKLKKENPQFVKVVFVRDSKLQTQSIRWQSSAPTVPAAKRPEPTVNIDGDWLVTLPAGFEFVGTIEKQPEGCWSFKEMRNLSGYYQLEGNVLKAAITDKKNPQEFEWLILNENVMVLMKSPQNIGADYRGATLRRGAKPGAKPELEPSRRSEPPSNPPDLKSDVVPNNFSNQFRLRQTQAKLTVAAASLARLLETNRKVPGTVPEPEIAKAKLEVELLEIELEALKSGVDLAPSKTTEDRAR